ncbi:MAG: T9SS type A sorting domain-containing protein, partial [Bacteroidota bacterium]
PNPATDRIQLYPISPNPLRDIGYISFDMDADRASLIELIDVQGRVHFQQQLEALAGYNRLPLNRAELSLSPGTYYIRLSGEGFSSVQPVLFE